MKKIFLIQITLIMILMLFVACSDKKDYHKMSSDNLFNEGWRAFKKGNFGEAEKCFSALSITQDAPFKGHYGLGWTYIKRYNFVNAKLQFNSFFTVINNGGYTVSDTISTNVRMGQTITYCALGEHQNAITSSNTIQPNWFLEYDTKINANNIIIIRAMSQFLLGRFSDALTTVRRIDGIFEADINTIEGRLKLSEKIDQLIALYN
jgi:hypothetical protein